jgi:hypothetical protein
MKNKLMNLIAAVSLSAVAFSSPASAGGLFGKKHAVFRRTVGTWIGKNVQGPILTPTARTATVAATTTVGTIVGIKTGQPQAGAVAGYLAGNRVNDIFAGK